MNYFKRLLRSKTIRGIITAALGGVVSQVPLLLTPEVVAQYGPIIQGVSVVLQASGLGTAVYGRINAQGPIKE